MWAHSGLLERTTDLLDMTAEPTLRTCPWALAGIPRLMYLNEQGRRHVLTHQGSFCR